MKYRTFRKDGRHALVCKDVKRPNNKVNNPVPVSSSSKIHKIVFRIPDEYFFALTEKYGKGIQYSLMKHLRETIEPVNTED